MQSRLPSLRALALTVAVTTMTLTALLVAQADPPTNPPPAGNADANDPGPPRDQPGPPPTHDRPLPPEQRAIAALGLTDEQKAQIDPILQDYQRKQDQLRDDLLNQLKAKLTPDQYRQFEAGFRHGPPPGGRQPQSTAPISQSGPPLSLPAGALAVTISGGHETDPRDGGRPVILIASALNVPPEVFRETFTHVKPAQGGQEPEPDQVRLNKQALMAGLAPYGVTNDRLDAVSNFYRYSGSRSQMWRTTPAQAYATVRNGVIVFTIVNPGAGYSSPPLVTVAGLLDVKTKVTLSFGTDFATNGSIKEISVAGSTNR